ncbi:lysozyme family protein [Enterococcus sp. AZ109]|uniref:lysozyme family protein n=1 Tax=Enterococcus sp. AZ109 TaxID=2774634 RepID=UPI003F291D9A
MKFFRKLFKYTIRTLLLLIIIAVGFVGYRTYQFTNNVNQYRQEVETIAQEMGVDDFTDTILGIMYTESKGIGTDLMQSSESAYGSRGQITSQQESIQYGVEHFAEVYQLSQQAGCDLSTAVQAYNYGFQYIDYVKNNGGKNSVELAEAYSRDVLSPGLGNSTQNQYRYVKLQSLLYNGGYLYSDGGNMFYADIVNMNERLVDWFYNIQK